MRDIITVPNSLLRQPCISVEVVTPEILSLCGDMVEFVTSHNGIGLAANQVGELYRVIVLAPEEFEEPLVVINPVFERARFSLLVRSFETCFSIPGLKAEVERVVTGTLEGMTTEGIEISMPAVGGLAILVQHEIDHLDGVLMTDRANVVINIMRE